MVQRTQHALTDGCDENPFPSLFHDTLQIEHTSTHDADASAGAKARAGGSGERLGALIDHVGLLVDGGGGVDGVDVDMRARTGAGGPTQPIQSKTFVSKPLNPNPDSRV